MVNLFAKLNLTVNRNPYLVGTAQKACNIDQDYSNGEYVMLGGTSATKVYLTFHVTGQATPIQSELKLNTNGIDINHFTSNQF